MVFVLFSLNVCVAQDAENSIGDNQTLKSYDNAQLISASDKIDTHMDVVSNSTFDVIGDYFKVKLSDANNNSIENARITFAINDVKYNRTTNSEGIASLKLMLADGSYNIASQFTGDYSYNPSSTSTAITMNNTRIIDSALSNSEIQKIIDNAKDNNVILFNGDSYSDINLIITKSLILLSKSNTTLISTSSSPTICIKGQNASLSTINGFNIQGSGDGIKVEGADYVTVANNVISTSKNGINALNVNYLNVTKNKLYKNSKSGIALSLSNSSHIYDNEISYNREYGVALGKSNNTYIYKNTLLRNSRYGIFLNDEINDIFYKSGPENVFISENTINNNYWDGISVNHAGNNISIMGNTITANEDNGISINQIGSNKIQSNVISHSYVGIKFADDYVKPNNQEITYNAIFRNRHVQVEAKDTYYSDYGGRLEIGENWYTDDGLICPRISTSNLRFTVTQIGNNLFQAAFYDSNGNLASLLPDRVLTYRTNSGETTSIAIKGGAATFTVDANYKDVIKSTVDRTSRSNVYSSGSSSSPINGQSPTYNYPNIPYGNMGGGDGEGGEGVSGDTNKGDGSSPIENSGSNVNNSTSQQDRPANSESNVNGSTSQQNQPANNPSNPINDISQGYEAESATSAASASPSSSGNDVGPGSQSVVKQILIDEDEFFKVTGISFIILLIILTIGLYYRDDILEMKSKM